MGLPELYFAVEGYVEANSTSDANTPLLRDELQDLMERYPD